VFFLVAGAVLFLRSQSGLDFLGGKLKAVLHESGLDVDWKSLEGTLPSSLSLTGVTLADRKGEFASVGRLSLALNLRPLLRGAVDVEDLTLEQVDFSRRPEIELKPDEDDKLSGPFHPPDVTANVRVSGLLNPEVLSPEAAGDAPGRLGLDARVKFVKGSLDADVTAFWLDGARGGVYLRTSARQYAEGAPDYLAVDLTARDGPGGPLSHLLDRPDWPAWSLAFKGSGPLSGWSGLFSLSLADEEQAGGDSDVDNTNNNNNSDSNSGSDDDDANTAAAGRAVRQVLTGVLNLSGASGSFKTDVLDSPNITLGLAAAAGADAPLPFPPAVAEKLGSPLGATGSAVYKGGTLSGSLSFFTPAARLDVARLLVENNDSGLTVASNGALFVDRSLLSAPGPAPETQEDGTADDAAQTDAAASDGAAASSSSPSSSSSPTSSSPSGGQSGGMPAVSPGVATASPAVDNRPDENAAASATADNDAAGKASAPTVASSSSSSSSSPAGQNMSLQYNLALRREGGKLTLSDLSLAGDELALKTAGEMTGDKPERLALHLRLGADSAWQKILGQFLADGAPSPGEIRVSAELKLAGPDDGSSGEERDAGSPDDGRQDDDRGGKFDLDAEITLDELAAFAGPLSGKISAELKASGTVDNLLVDLKATSPKIAGPGQAFPDVVLSYNGSLRGLPDFSGLGGTLTLGTGRTMGGPVSLSSRVALDIVPAAGAGGIINRDAGGVVNGGSDDAGVPDNSAVPDDAADAAGTNVAGKPASGRNIAIADLVLAGGGGESVDLKIPSLAVELRPGAAPKIAGSLDLKIGDWKTLGELTGLDLAGTPASLSASVQPDDAGGGRVKVFLDLPQFRMGPSLSLSQVRLDLAADGRLSDPGVDLTLSVGPGRAGGVDIGGGRLEARGTGDDGRVSADFKAPGGQDLLTLAGTFNLNARNATVSNLAVNLPQIPGGARLAGPVSLDFAAGLSVGRTSLVFGGGGKADFSMALEPMKVDAAVTDLPLSLLSGVMEDPPRGRVSLKADYREGGSGSFDLRATMTAPPALEGLSRTLDISAAGRIENARSAAGTVAVSPGRGQEVKVDYRLPLTPEGLFFKPDLSGPVSAGLVWKGPVAPLWGLVGLADRSLTGQLDLAVSLGGTLANPKPKVRLYLANGVYEDLVLGLGLSNINMEVRDQEDGDLRLVLEAGDGAGGKLSLEGAVKPMGSPPSIAVRGQLKRLAPLVRDDASAVVTGLVSLDGPFAALVVKADAVVEQAEINLDQLRGGGSVRTLEIENDMAPVSRGPQLELKINLPKQVFIRGRGLDSEWAGDVVVTNPQGRILVGGTLRPVRGTFDLLSKQFIFTGGEIRFQKAPNFNPALAVELTRQTSSLLAMVKVAGTLDRPRIIMESQPPHPSDEVLAQVLFGKRVSQLSRVEALQLANSLRVLAGFGGDIGLTVLGTMRDALGLSVLRVSDSSEAADNRILGGNSFRDNLGLDDDGDSGRDSTTIEAGRYIGDNIYVGLEQNLSDNSTGVRVEVELAPSVTLQSRTSSTSNRVGLGWKKDY
jgi:translocation and assembly module TamB